MSESIDPHAWAAAAEAAVKAEFPAITVTVNPTINRIRLKSAYITLTIEDRDRGRYMAYRLKMSDHASFDDYGFIRISPKSRDEAIGEVRTYAEKLHAAYHERYSD